MRSMLILVFSLLAGCGSVKQFGGKKSDQKPGAQTEANRENAKASGAGIVVNDDDLPTCDSNNNGDLVYVASAKVFRACTNGKWSTIDLKGEKGDPGDNAAADTGSKEMNLALAVYKSHRRSVFRTTLTCALTQPVSASCQTLPASAPILGSAFLCDKDTICTNRHVLSCPTCYAVQQFSLQATEGTSDSVNSDGTPAAPFFSTTALQGMKVHPTHDLAKVVVKDVPTGIEPIPLATDSFAKNGDALTAVLSLSFALGFQDLYVDVGYVNTKFIGECDREGGMSGYGCPREQVDFSTTNDTDHGSSGSPLIDILGGKVIGVTTAGTEDENANFTWAIDASRLSEIK